MDKLKDSDKPDPMIQESDETIMHREHRLKRLAEETFPEGYVNERGFVLEVRIRPNEPVSLEVDVQSECIHIKNPNHYTDAEKLQRAYDEHGEPIPTLKKDYD